MTSSLSPRAKPILIVSSIIVACVLALAFSFGDSPLVARLVSVLVAIAVGCGGVIGLFYALNALVQLLPYRWRPRVLPWVFVGPAAVLLGAYLVLPTLNTIYLSFLDRRSENFVGLANYAFVATDRVMTIAFISPIWG